MRITPALLVALVTSLLLSTSSSLAGEPPEKKKAGPSSEVQKPPTRERVVQRTRIFINPETGKPSHRNARGHALELSPRERAMINRSDVGLTERTLANGTVAIDLQGGFRNMLTVHIDPVTGNLTNLCAIDDQASVPNFAAEGENP